MELAPKLVLEKEFFNLQLYWPHPDSLNGEAIFLSKTDWNDEKLIPLNFSLQNFGQNPAIDVRIVWDLDDSADELEVPEFCDPLGLTVAPALGPGLDGVKMLFHATPSGGYGVPLYRRWTTEIPSCSPGQKRKVSFPTHILSRIFVRGLQLGSSIPLKDITLTATVTSTAVDESEHVNKFLWKVIPFHHGSVDPIVVHGHFNEISQRRKSDEPLVM